MDDKGLEEILNASDPGDEDPIAEPKSDIHEASPLLDERPRDEKGRFAPKETGEETAPEASPAPEPQSTIPETALLGERRRRQEAERERDELRAQFAQFQRQPQQPQEMPDFWENPNAVISNQVDQAVSQALQRWQVQQLQEKADMAEAAARAKYQDYDDAFAKFREQIEVNPSLIQQMRQASDPAEFVYQRGKQAIDMADPDTYRAKIEAEVRAKLEAEMLARPQSLPQTTAGLRSVAGRGGPEWTGPTDLKSIL